MATLKDVANMLSVSWDTVKEIHTHYLQLHYSPPSLEGVECIGIDEFAVKKGHVYKTIVVDLMTGRIVYVGDGKGVESLKKFWQRVKKLGIKIKYVATDLSAAFTASVMENAPDASMSSTTFTPTTSCRMLWMRCVASNTPWKRMSTSATCSRV